MAGRPPAPAWGRPKRTNELFRWLTELTAPGAELRLLDSAVPLGPALSLLHEPPRSLKATARWKRQLETVAKIEKSWLEDRQPSADAADALHRLGWRVEQEH